MPQRSVALNTVPNTALKTGDLPSAPSDALVRLVEKGSESAERGVLIAELIEPVSLSFAPHLDRADVRALVDRLAFA